MQDFTAHRLEVRAQVVEPVLLNEHKGSALRGALYHALRDGFCSMRDLAGGCPDCPLAQACPVCTLVSTLDPANRLGRDAARPYTVQPPLDEARTLYRPGETLRFGLTLYAEALRLFPYVIMALYRLERDGLGLRLESNHWRRGTLSIAEVWADNPLSGQRASVARAGERLVQAPDIPITHAQVLDWCQRWNSPRVTLQLLTPTRLTAQERLVRPGQVRLPVLLARLLDRLESLSQHFSRPLALDYAALLTAAERVQTWKDATRWVELRSYSTRQERATPIGGLMGQVTFAADDWEPFLPWLAWGQFTHVGKDAVKGNGWYRIVEDER